MFVIHYYINKQILDSYLHTKSAMIWSLFTIVLNWVFLRFPWQRQAFWNFQASKPFIHMPYNISIKLHPIPSTLNVSRFLWQQPNHGYQFPTSKSTWKPNFAQIGGFIIWWPFCTLVTMAMAILNLFTPPPTPQKICHILRWIFLQSGS